MRHLEAKEISFVARTKLKVLLNNDSDLLLVCVSSLTANLTISNK
jgi:hypothetical protein